MEKRKLPRKAVAARYGTCTRTICRWENEPELEFAQPEYINGRAYYDGGKLDEFDARMAQRGREAAAKVGSGKSSETAAQLTDGRTAKLKRYLPDTD
jgi:hypothetical protein